jgi:hypothetical protein
MNQVLNENALETMYFAEFVHIHFNSLVCIFVNKGKGKTKETAHFMLKLEISAP